MHLTLFCASLAALAASSVSAQSCSSPTAIQVPGSFDFAVANRSDDSGLPGCGESIGDTYYLTQPLRDVHVRIATCATYDGSATMATMLAAYLTCSDNSAITCNLYACGSLQSAIEFVAPMVPTAFYVRVAGHVSSYLPEPWGNGTFTVRVTPCNTCDSLNATDNVFDRVCNRTLNCGGSTGSTTTGSSGVVQAPFGRWGFTRHETYGVAGHIATYRDVDRSVYIHGGQALVGSGVIDTGAMFAYSTLRNAWQEVPTTGDGPGLRFFHSGVYVGDRWFVYGGAYRDEGGISISVNEHHVFDFMRRSWQQLPSFGLERAGHTAVLSTSQDLIVIFGGIRSQAAQRFDRVDIFDLSTMTWWNDTTGFHVQGVPPVPRYAHAALVTKDNRMVVYGGSAFAGYDVNGRRIDVALSDVAVFDINTTTWLPRPMVSGVSPARLSHQVFYVPAADAMLVFLGVRYNANSTVMVFRTETYRLQLDTWSWYNVSGLGPVVPRPRYAHTVTAVGGSAFLFGGINATAFPTESFFFNVDSPMLGGTTGQFVPASAAAGADSVDMLLRLDADYASFNYTNFAGAVCRLLDMPCDLLVVTSFVQGSVIVNFTMFSAPGADSQRLADSLIAKLSADANALGSIGAVTSVEQTSERLSPSDGTDSSDLDVPLVVGLTVGLGGAALLAAVILVALLARKKRRAAHQRQREPVTLQDLESPTAATTAEVAALLPSLPFPPLSFIDYGELSIERQLGAGAFGTVFKARYRGNWCVVKQGAQSTADRQAQFLKEAYAMTRLRPSPNIVQLLGVCVDPAKPLAIVLEWVEGGSLDQLLYDRTKPVTAELAVAICRDVAAGCRHLHADGILHCDLSARNVLIVPRADGLCTAKISDFGLSHFIEAGTAGTYSSDTALKLPIRWAAPEVLENPSQTSKAGDVWSFGVLMWEILQREVPYRQLLENAQVIVAVTKGQRLPMPTTVEHPAEMDDILLQCFRTDPNDRPTISEIHERLEKLLADLVTAERPYELSPSTFINPYGTVNSSAYSIDSSMHYLADGRLTGATSESNSPQPSPRMDHETSVESRTATPALGEQTAPEQNGKTSQRSSVESDGVSQH